MTTSIRLKHTFSKKNMIQLFKLKSWQREKLVYMLLYDFYMLKSMKKIPSRQQQFLPSHLKYLSDVVIYKRITYIWIGLSVVFHKYTLVRKSV